MCHKVFKIDHHRDIVKSEVYNRYFLNAHARCLQSIILGVQLTNVLQPSWRIYGASIINTSHFQVSQMYADIHVKYVNFDQFLAKPKCGDKR